MRSAEESPGLQSGKRRAVRSAVALALVALVTACGGPSDSQKGQSDSPSPASSHNERAGEVETESGGTINFKCAGEGNPTILLESGGGASTQEFRALIDPLAERTRVCTYDQPGNGLSRDVPYHRRTLEDLCQVQDEVIRALAIPAPYVLFGQSLGGNIVIGCAARHADRVAGLVIVEGYHDDPQEVRKEARDEGWTWQGNPAHLDGVAIADELDALDMPIGSFPVLILTATDADPGNVKNQKYWLRLSPNSRQVVVEGGHNLHDDNPEIVIRETLALLGT